VEQCSVGYCTSLTVEQKYKVAVEETAASANLWCLNYMSYIFAAVDKTQLTKAHNLGLCDSQALVVWCLCIIITLFTHLCCAVMLYLCIDAFNLVKVFSKKIVCIRSCYNGVAYVCCQEIVVCCISHGKSNVFIPFCSRLHSRQVCSLCTPFQLSCVIFLVLAVLI